MRSFTKYSLYFQCNFSCLTESNLHTNNKQNYPRVSLFRGTTDCNCENYTQCFAEGIWLAGFVLDRTLHISIV